MVVHTLGNDGTIDTVAVCNGCGKESRYTFQPTRDSEHKTYDNFAAWVLKDAADEHECDDDGREHDD